MLFWYLALHTGCALQNLESKTKELFLCYCKFVLADPSTFQGVTLHDLVQIENCFHALLMIVPWNGQNKKLARFFNKVDIFFPAQEISIFMKILLAV